LVQKECELKNIIKKVKNKNFEYQEMLNLLLSVNRKLLLRRNKDAKKFKQMKNLQYYKQLKDIKKQQKNQIGKDDSRYRVLPNGEIQKLRPISYIKNKNDEISDMIKHSFSDFEESEFSIKLKARFTSGTGSNKIIIDSDKSNTKYDYSPNMLKNNFDGNVSDLEGSLKKQKETNEKLIINANETEYVSRASTHNSVKLKNLSSKNTLSSNLNLPNILVNEKKKNLKDTLGNQKLGDQGSFTSSKYSEDIFKNAKKIKSQGNSEYLNDFDSDLSSVGNVRKITFNNFDIATPKEGKIFLF
jgi:hypothetical protein